VPGITGITAYFVVREIPSLGFGTYGMRRSEMPRIILIAIQAGFRHFDTAQMYQNESELGECHWKSESFPQAAV
jgi:diketogulonate reductase-like aldo/keto reductase